jgi:hypothetical protein
MWQSARPLPVIAVFTGKNAIVIGPGAVENERWNPVSHGA